MNTFVHKSAQPRQRAVTNSYANGDAGYHSTLQPFAHRPAAVAQRALQQSLNSSSKVQSQLQLQEMLNHSPRVAAQMKLADVLSSRSSKGLQMKQPVQRQEAVEEEELTQRQPALEEEEPLQGKLAPVQREAMDEEEELLQTKSQVAQKQDMLEEEEPLQSKSEPVQRKENKTGLPDQLKAGVENLSGLSMDDVKVHYNSPQPAQMQALAYTQGTEIHVGPGQEKHLAHEAWHVAQQKQGRVRPTSQFKGVSLNTDTALEGEADRMGAEALRQRFAEQTPSQSVVSQLYPLTVQRALMSTTARGNVAQLTGNVVQFEGEWKENIVAAASKVWEVIKAAHTTKAAPLILNALSLMTAAVRYARNDSSVGAQIGSGLLALLASIEAAWTAVEEWQAATGEGKDLWKKRVDAIEKVTTSLILAASMFALPFNPTIGAAIGSIGAASVKVLRSGYDWLANKIWSAPQNEQSQANYGTII